MLYKMFSGSHFKEKKKVTVTALKKKSDQVRDSVTAVSYSTQYYRQRELL
jgi:hypothetical protein